MIKKMTALVIACVLAACSTTTNPNGTSTTAFDANSPAAQAAISAATQIAVAAASAAIQTYLPGTPRARASVKRAALDSSAAMKVSEASTEAAVAAAQPSLPASVVHDIVSKAYGQ